MRVSFDVLIGVADVAGVSMAQTAQGTAQQPLPLLLLANGAIGTGGGPLAVQVRCVRGSNGLFVWSCQLVASDSGLPD